MNIYLRSAATAVFIAAAIQCFTLGLAHKLPPEVCRPAVQSQRQLTYPAGKAIFVDNVDGAVRVKTHAGESIDVVATIRAYPASSEAVPAAQAFIDTMIHPVVRNGDIHITSTNDEAPQALERLSVDYEIVVPVGTDVTVKGTGAGNVWIEAGCGRVSVQGNKTDIDITEPRGAVLAKSNTGRIRVNSAKDKTTLETVNGSIYVDLRGGALQASTQNGNIVANLTDPTVEMCDLTSLNGGITLVLAEASSASISAKTSHGVVRTDVPLDPHSGVQKRRSLHGKIGQGLTQLTMESLNGNIWITRSSA